eukprot:704181-Rhodomonas_salina.4
MPLISSSLLSLVFCASLLCPPLSSFPPPFSIASLFSPPVCSRRPRQQEGRTSHSTAQRIPPYAIAIPHIAYIYMLSQYRISHTSSSTAHCIAPYAISEPHIA